MVRSWEDGHDDSRRTGRGGGLTSDRDSTDSPNENEFFDRLPRCVIDAAGVSRQFSSSDDDEDDSRASC